MRGREFGRGRAVSVVATLDLAAKGILVLMIVLVTLDPEWGNLEGKAPTQRAVLYPIVAIAIPALRWVGIVGRTSYPWLADLLLTLVGFADVLGNRLDLFDRIVWFDDWMHFFNAGLTSASVLLLTTRPRASFLALLERSVAVAMTVSLGWELWEYFSFVTESPEHAMAYSDTIGDFSLGWIGAVAAAAGVHLACHAMDHGSRDRSRKRADLPSTARFDAVADALAPTAGRSSIAARSRSVDHRPAAG